MSKSIIKICYILYIYNNPPLLRCNNENGPMVLTLHQERPIRLPGCPQDQDLCSLKTLKEQYEKHVSSCNFDELCHIHQHDEH